jgi:hypothetical protein
VKRVERGQNKIQNESKNQSAGKNASSSTTENAAFSVACVWSTVSISKLFQLKTQKKK